MLDHPEMPLILSPIDSIDDAKKLLLFLHCLPRFNRKWHPVKNNNTVYQVFCLESLFRQVTSLGLSIPYINAGVNPIIAQTSVGQGLESQPIVY